VVVSTGPEASVHTRMRLDTQVENGENQGTRQPSRPGIVILALAILYPAFMIQFGVNYSRISNIDFPSFWCAAQAAFEHGTSPYAREYLQTLLPAQKVFPLVPEMKEFPYQMFIYPQETELPAQHVFPFLHAPPSLLAFFPLSLFSYEAARKGFLVLNHLLLLFLMYFVPIKLLGLKARKHALLLILGAAYTFSFYPLVVLLNHGQVNLVLAAALCLFWFWVREDKPILASLALVFSILLKTYPAVLLLFLVLCRKFRAFVLSSLLLFAALTLSLLVLPEMLWEQWLGSILPTGGYASTPLGLFSPAAVWNQSLNGFLSRIFTESQWSPNPLVDSPMIARTLCYLGALSLLAASSWAVLQRYRRDSETAFDWAMLLFFPLMFLIAPLAWEHHLVYVLVTAAALLIAALQSWDQNVRLTGLTVLSVLVLATQGLLAFKFYAVLALWALALERALSSEEGLVEGS